MEPISPFTDRFWSGKEEYGRNLSCQREYVSDSAVRFHDDTDFTGCVVVNIEYKPRCTRGILVFEASDVLPIIMDKGRHPSIQKVASYSATSLHSEADSSIFELIHQTILQRMSSAFAAI